MEKYLVMNNKHTIPRFAFGTFQVEDDQAENIMEKALEVGYRHFDCAWIYRNEKSIGDVLAKNINQGKIQRSDLFLTGKLWSSFHKYERVREQCLMTIENLQCEYLDLFLIHWPFAFVDQNPRLTDECSIEIDDSIDFIETWKAMELLVDDGLVKSLGLSNFNEEQIQRILNICKYKPVVNQVEIHPYCPQYELEEFCRQHEILLEAYGPLGGARDWKTKKANDPNLLTDEIIQQIANKYNTTTSSVLLRYILDRNFICIVKSSNLERIEENYRIFQKNQFNLSCNDFQEISEKITIRYRVYWMEEGFNAKLYPFRDWKQTTS